MKSVYFKHGGKPFYFLFSLLRPILHTVVHVVRHNFVISCSFLLTLAALCSLTVPDHPCMFFIHFYQILPT